MVARIVVVGAGMIGAACSYFLARDGHDVTVIDRGAIGGGTTSRGEGNILLSDKAPGPELDFARRSVELWRALAARIGAEPMEWEGKGGLVIAPTAAALDSLHRFAREQAAAGVDAVPVGAADLADYEPHLAAGLAGGVFYPGDQQVQPVRAAVALLAAARGHGASIRPGVELAGVDTGPTGAVRSAICRQPGGTLALPADVVVNAAGTWGGQVSQRIGAEVPVLPRRGFILVTEPLPPVVRHKVYTADYVDNVASSDAALETSLVVEGTRGGTVLIGASRERVGFDTTVSRMVLQRLARQAIAIFPVLAQVSLLRCYQGFRPYCPDHLPVIGPDPRVPGVYHACGHEGAGIGLAPATGELISDLVAGRAVPDYARAFGPDRFAAARTVA